MGLEPTTPCYKLALFLQVVIERYTSYQGVVEHCSSGRLYVPRKADSSTHEHNIQALSCNFIDSRYILDAQQTPLPHRSSRHSL
jgi:hypothetical protein